MLAIVFPDSFFEISHERFFLYLLLDRNMGKKCSLSLLETTVRKRKENHLFVDTIEL